MSDEQTTKVQDQEAIQVFTKACQIQAELKINLSDDKQPCISKMIHLYDSHLLLEGFQPEPSMRGLFEKGQRLECRFSLSARKLYYFRSVFHSHKGNIGEQFLIERPKELFQIQRRQAYRVDPFRTLPAECIAIAGRSVKKLVRVVDISIDGICLSFPKRGELRVGAKIAGIQLILNGKETVSLDGVVRSERPAASDRFLLGIQWTENDAEALHILQHYVVACQRSEAQRMD